MKVSPISRHAQRLAKYLDYIKSISCFYYLLLNHFMTLSPALLFLRFCIVLYYYKKKLTVRGSYSFLL